MTSSRTSAALALAILAAVACGGSGGGEASGENLLPSGDFEAAPGGDLGWDLTARHANQEARWVESGGYVSLSARLEDGVDWPQAVAKDRFTVSPGTVYEMSVVARSESGGLLLPIVVFVDGDGGDLVGMSPGTLDIATGDWTGYTHRVTAPDGAATAYVILRLALNSSLTDAGVLSVDVSRVSVTEVPG